MLANLAQVNPEKLGHSLAALYDGKLASVNEEGDFLKTIEMLKDVLTKTADGSVTPGAFTPEARAALFPEKIKQIGESLKGYGAIMGLRPGGRSEEDGLYSYRPIRIMFQDRGRLCRVMLTKDGKIAGLVLAPE